MISYMDLIQRCFYSSTGWQLDNSYEHILATSRNLLQFPIPTGAKVIVSNRNTKHNYSSVNISQGDALEGSLSYLSSSTDLDEYYKPSNTLPLIRVLQGYRDLLPDLPTKASADNKNYLLYGKMYFPSRYLEGMFIKRFSPNYQLLVKFVNTPRLNKLTQSTSIFTFYLQRQTENSSHDFIYSTREDLFGFRCLYHFNFLDSKPNSESPLNKTDFLTSKLRSNVLDHPSKFSTGCELWYAAGSVSPGLSVAARYTTYIDSIKFLMNSDYSSTSLINSDIRPYIFSNLTNNHRKLVHSIPYAVSSIHPLTFTLAANPLLGTIESTYAISSDAYIHGDNYHGNPDMSYSGKLGIVLSSKYQFNIYSYDSDLILGLQLLRSKLSLFEGSPAGENSDANKLANLKYNYNPFDQHNKATQLSHISQHNVVYKVSENGFIENNVVPTDVDKKQKIPQLQIDDKVTSLNSGDKGEEYISSLKISGSLTKGTVRGAWEGKFYDWFVSSGASIDLKSLGTGLTVLKYGIEFSYNS